MCPVCFILPLIVYFFLFKINTQRPLMLKRSLRSYVRCYVAFGIHVGFEPCGLCVRKWRRSTRRRTSNRLGFFSESLPFTHETTLLSLSQTCQTCTGFTANTELDTLCDSPIFNLCCVVQKVSGPGVCSKTEGSVYVSRDRSTS